MTRALAAHAVLLAAAAGCVGPGSALRWTSPAVPPPGPFIALPDGAPVAGLGVKLTPRGLMPRRCLSRAESLTSGGTFSVEVRAVDGAPWTGDRDTVAFVAGSARQAEAARPSPGGPAPVAALLTVRAREQWTSLDESTAELSEPATRLLAERQYWDFFERCGTSYVHAARREPAALIYVALYPATPAEREQWAARIAERASAGATADDLVALQVLDRIVEGSRPAFVAVRADADEAVEVVDPGRGRGEGTGRLVGNALRASFGADRGRIEELSLRPWSSLPAAAPLLDDLRAPQDSESGRRERLFQRLKLLEDRALDRQTLLAQVTELGGAGPGSCRTALERDLAAFSWDAYYRCRDAAREALPAALEEVDACRPVLAALGGDAPPATCERLGVLDEGRFADPRRRSDTRYPLLLEPGTGDPDDRLFTDAEQLAGAPATGGVGAQMDRFGGGYSQSCTISAGAGAGASQPEEPAPLPRSFSQDEWDLRSPAKKPPAPPPAPPPAAPEKETPLCLERPGGPLCLHPKGALPAARPSAPAPAPAPAPSISSSRPPEPKPASEPGARREVILSVSANRRLEGERRWAWWKSLLYPLLFSRSAPEPRPIYRGSYELRTLQEGDLEQVRLTDEAAALASKDLEAFYRQCGTHRVRQVVQRKGVVYHFAPGSPGDVEISALPYGVSRKVAGGDAFHPERVQDFLAGRPRWLEQLSERSTAIPQRLVLEPWSEILLEQGLVQPHQLSPAPGPRE